MNLTYWFSSGALFLQGGQRFFFFFLGCFSSGRGLPMDGGPRPRDLFQRHPVFFLPSCTNRLFRLLPFWGSVLLLPYCRSRNCMCPPPRSTCTPILHINHTWFLFLLIPFSEGVFFPRRPKSWAPLVQEPPPSWVVSLLPPLTTPATVNPSLVDARFGFFVDLGLFYWLPLSPFT